MVALRLNLREKKEEIIIIKKLDGDAIELLVFYRFSKKIISREFFPLRKIKKIKNI